MTLTFALRSNVIFIFSITVFNSDRVRFDPLGKHKPERNKFADTLVPK